MRLTYCTTCSLVKECFVAPLRIRSQMSGALNTCPSDYISTMNYFLLPVNKTFVICISSGRRVCIRVAETICLCRDSMYCVLRACEPAAMSCCRSRLAMNEARGLRVYCTYILCVYEGWVIKYWYNTSQSVSENIIYNTMNVPLIKYFTIYTII